MQPIYKFISWKERLIIEPAGYCNSFKTTVTFRLYTMGFSMPYCKDRTDRNLTIHKGIRFETATYNFFNFYYRCL
jgi:uncharacterized CHY-type Zn-finger protein